MAARTTARALASAGVLALLVVACVVAWRPWLRPSATVPVAAGRRLHGAAAANQSLASAHSDVRRDAAAGAETETLTIGGRLPGWPCTFGETSWAGTPYGFCNGTVQLPLAFTVLGNRTWAVTVADTRHVATRHGASGGAVGHDVRAPPPPRFSLYFVEHTREVGMEQQLDAAAVAAPPRDYVRSRSCVNATSCCQQIVVAAATTWPSEKLIYHTDYTLPPGANDKTYSVFVVPAAHAGGSPVPGNVSASFSAFYGPPRLPASVGLLAGEAIMSRFEAAEYSANAAFCGSNYAGGGYSAAEFLVVIIPSMLVAFCLGCCSKRARRRLRALDAAEAREYIHLPTHARPWLAPKSAPAASTTPVRRYKVRRHYGPRMPLFDQSSSSSSDSDESDSLEAPLTASDALSQGSRGAERVAAVYPVPQQRPPQHGSRGVPADHEHHKAVPCRKRVRWLRAASLLCTWVQLGAGLVATVLLFTSAWMCATEQYVRVTSRPCGTSPAQACPCPIVKLPVVSNSFSPWAALFTTPPALLAPHAVLYTNDACTVPTVSVLVREEALRRMGFDPPTAASADASRHNATRPACVRNAPGELDVPMPVARALRHNVSETMALWSYAELAASIADAQTTWGAATLTWTSSNSLWTHLAGEDVAGSARLLTGLPSNIVLPTGLMFGIIALAVHEVVVLKRRITSLRTDVRRVFEPRQQRRSTPPDRGCLACCPTKRDCRRRLWTKVSSSELLRKAVSASGTALVIVVTFPTLDSDVLSVRSPLTLNSLMSVGETFASVLVLMVYIGVGFAGIMACCGMGTIFLSDLCGHDCSYACHEMPGIAKYVPRACFVSVSMALVIITPMMVAFMLLVSLYSKWRVLSALVVHNLAWLASADGLLSFATLTPANGRGGHSH